MAWLDYYNEKKKSIMKNGCHIVLVHIQLDQKTRANRKFSRDKVKENGEKLQFIRNKFNYYKGKYKKKDFACNIRDEMIEQIKSESSSRIFYKEFPVEKKESTEEIASRFIEDVLLDHQLFPDYQTKIYNKLAPHL